MFPSHAPWKQEILFFLSFLINIIKTIKLKKLKYSLTCLCLLITYLFTPSLHAPVYINLFKINHSSTSKENYCLPVISSLHQCLYPSPLRTCAISKASSSCPLPVKKVTSFFMSPVAMQYGIASSLSSAISWSALLQHKHFTIPK